jgi:hypothetical protein
MSLDLYLECRACNQSFWTRNITHNLGPMWREAGVYDALYQSQGMKADEVRAVVLAGLDAMKREPERFKAFNAPNGWGLHEHAVAFLESFIAAIYEHPDAVIRVSR